MTTMDKLKLPAEVLEYNAGQFVNDNGGTVKFSYGILNIGGREFKINSDVDLTRYQNKHVTLTVELYPKKQIPTLRIVSVEGESEEM